MKDLISGAEIAGEYIRDLGILGIIGMILIIILCFFFPFISSLPIQIAAGLAYGLWWGSLIVSIAFALASQLLYLLKRNTKIFYSEKQLKKEEELRARIEGSKLGIVYALIIAYIVPCIPFLLISRVALQGLKYPKYTLFTVVGPIGEVLVTLYLGKKLVSTSPLASIITLVIMIIIVVLSIVFNDKIVDFIFRPRKEKKNEQH